MYKQVEKNKVFQKTPTQFAYGIKINHSSRSVWFEYKTVRELGGFYIFIHTVCELYTLSLYSLRTVWFCQFYPHSSQTDNSKFTVRELYVQFANCHSSGSVLNIYIQARVRTVTCIICSPISEKLD